ncbi:MAG: N-acetylmuramoyl-L-alanine amidase [Chloroflexota bacterium]
MKTQPSEDVPVESTSEVSIWANLRTVCGVAFLLATLFTAWIPKGTLPTLLGERLTQVWKPGGGIQPETVATATVSSRPRIGIVSGHWGFDSGTVCDDGLTEAQVNLDIATLVQQSLIEMGFDVDLLKEFDPRLEQYQASLLISIHADSCSYINDEATGFKVAAALATEHPEKAARLIACLRSRYSQITGLQFHPSVTSDMSNYHTFNEINGKTTAAIIETGFLNLDRQLLTQHPDVIAKGIVAGIKCFVYNEDIPVIPSPTP